MRAIAKRVDALEEATGGSRWVTQPTHPIIVEEGQSYGSALADYRARHSDKALEPDHNVIWIQIVSPKLGAEGRIIPQQRKTGDGPSLADVLSGAVQ